MLDEFIESNLKLQERVAVLEEAIFDHFKLTLLLGGDDYALRPSEILWKQIGVPVDEENTTETESKADTEETRHQKKYQRYFRYLKERVKDR